MNELINLVLLSCNFFKINFSFVVGSFKGYCLLLECIHCTTKGAMLSQQLVTLLS